MLTFVLSLPLYRLKISLSTNKRQSLREKKPLRLGRFLRKVFEHKRIKAILGGSLAFLVFFTSVFSSSASALGTISQTDLATLSPGVVELTTKQSVRVPVENIELTQGYTFFHPGIDLNGKTGDPVYPIMEGRVESVIYDRFGLGKHIIVAHGSGLKSIYAHLSKVEVKAGDMVNTKAEIGQVGKSGRAFGDHLHFELLENDRHINPRTILPLN